MVRKMQMPKISCRCTDCGCKDVCEFYETAIQPVLKVIEDPSYDLTDYITKKYLNGLKEVVENFYCDQYE